MCIYLARVKARIELYIPTIIRFVNTVYTAFWWENLREGDHMEEISVDGRIILKLSFWDLDGLGVDWIGLARDRDTCWAHVNAVINLHFP